MGNYVNTAKGNKVTSDAGNQGINVVKSSACWVWRPQIKVQAHVSKNSGSYICKRFDYVDPEGRLKSEIYPTSLTLRSMMEGMLPLGDELKVVRLLAKAPSELNIVPQKDLTCLLAKATNDESMRWHRRLGHINFKNINKLVKDNLMRGLPSKYFKNDQTCVACLKGKQHKFSFKSKLHNFISQPLFMLHMDLFGPTSVSSIMRKKYYLVITDDFSIFTWVFFLATKDETSRILKSFIIEIKNLVEKKGKIIKCDNETEFKIRVMNEFCEEKGGGPKWLFDIDALSKSMNYAPVSAGTNSNDFVGKGASFDAGQSSMKTGSSQEYILMPLWEDNSLFDSSSQASNSHNKDKHGPSQASESDNHERTNAESSTKTINTTKPVNTATPTYADYPNDPLMPDLEDAGIFDNAYDDRDEGAEADYNKLETVISVSLIPSTRIHKDHPKEHIIGEVKSAVQTSKMAK
nr:putative ribonuclease H-like domain-containing protein [Tanacetum cinerariifolium]